MKIIFDLDHTLYSTKRLYFTWVESLGEIGIKEELFERIFKESKGGGDLYDKKIIFDLLIKEKPEIDCKLLEERWARSHDRSEELVYPDVLPFLGKFKNYDFYLLSYGRNEIQRYKIKRANLEHFFKEIHITRDIDKVSVVGEILDKTEKAVFVDDNPDVLAKVKGEYSEVITVRINRGEGKHRDWPDNPEIDFSIKNLKQLERILLTKL